MKKIFNIISAVTVALCATSQAAVAQTSPSAKIDATPRPAAVCAKELRDMKWGIYLCWSFCCFSGQQWTPNVKDISLFNPTGCDTDQWVRTAKEAGMGFICFLTKHHDGFCLWDTDTSQRKVTRSPLSRDVLAELRKSCDKYGIKLALYYSESEWRWPGAREGQGYFNGINPEEKKAQLKELFARYGPIDFIWFDNAVGDGGLNHKETAAWVKSFQPNCFVGFSSGSPAGDMQIGEDGRPGPMNEHAVVCPYMDNNRFDRWNPSYKGYLVTEILQPIIAEPSPMWFYDPSAGENCRSAEDLYTTYLGAVKHGNVFDLGVSPNRAGKMRDIEVATLRQVGDMIRHPKVRPASLSTGKCATASSVWKPGYEADKAVDNDDTSSWTAAPSARSGWMEVDLGQEQRFGVVEIRERFSLPCYPIKRFAIEYRSDEAETWKVAAEGTRIGIQRTLVFPPVTARYVRLNILNAEPVNGLLVVEEFRVWPPALSLGKPVAVSSVWIGREKELSPSHITDGDAATIWGAEKEARDGWVTVDLQKECEVSAAMLSDSPYGRTQEFDVEAEIGGVWKKIAAGKSIGSERHLTFPPVKARQFRLNIRKASDTPTLAEFQLFGTAEESTAKTQHVSTAVLSSNLCAATPVQVHLAPSGNDSAPGSAEQPVATLGRAAALAHEIAQTAKQPVGVLIHGGVYRLNEPWIIGADASGTEAAPIILEAASGETPIFTGAEALRNLHWEKGENGIWRTPVPAGTTADRLRVNGTEMTLARYPNFKDGEYMGGTVPWAELNQCAATWKHSPVGAFVHGPHKHNWGSVHSRITGMDVQGNLIREGGWQVNQQPGHGGTAFIEGVLDELDVPGEWYLDSAASTLYLVPPADVDLAKARVEIIRTPTLVRIVGTPGQPVHDVVLRGLLFTGTARTFMEAKEPLLRGDWCVARQGAVFVENARRVAVEHCCFERLGGNGVFISRHADAVAVRACEFAHLCASAVCVAGDPSAVREASFWSHWITEPHDLTPGPKGEAYPRDCVIEDNLMHHLGTLEKQTAGVLISMSERITVAHNTIYHLPRSGITIHDGTWGGHRIVGNDVFDTVRETADHGPFNAWGRDRHWIGSGLNGPHVRDYALLDSRTPTIIERNRFAHYWSTHSWGIDLDDGASNYIVRNNLCLGCAVKLREGISRTVENNICVSSEAPSKHCCYKDNDDVIRGNIFVNIRSSSALEMIWAAHPEWTKEIDYNLYFNTTKESPIFVWGGGNPQHASLAQWQAQGFDKHSVFADPKFIDPDAGDYRVKDGSPAMAIGFKNFPMDDFGTRDPVLKVQAQTDRELLDKAHGEVAKALKSGTKPVFGAGFNERVEDWCGAKVKDLAGMTDLSAAGLSEEKGVVVLEVPSGSAAAKFGLKNGDVILKVNGQVLDRLPALRKIGAEKVKTLSLWRMQKPVTLP